MTSVIPARTEPTTGVPSLPAGQAAALDADDVLARLDSGFVNEYRAEKTAEALHSTIRHSRLVVRDGHSRTVDVTGLVPGDVVTVQLGEVVPADLRLLATTDLECDESVLTGESVPAEKSPVPVAAGTALADLTSCALMGTVVRAATADSSATA